MSGIFNLESPVVRAVTRVGDLAVLSLMWFVGCIPVVTIGASGTAMYSAIHKVFSQKEGIAAAEFVKSFKSNFCQATLSFLPLGALELLLLAECFVTDFLQEQGTAWVNLRPVFLVLCYLAAGWMVMVAAYSARFQDSAKTTIRQSAILLLANPLQSVLPAAAVVAAVRRMNQEVGISPSLRELNKVEPEHFGDLAALAMHDTCMGTNLTQVTPMEVVAVYTAAYRGI